MSVISISIANFYSVPEPPTRVIAQNNALAASTKNDNPYLTERLFDSVPSLSPTEKHFEHQASILKRNRYVINIQSLKYSGVAYSTSSIIAKYPSPTISPYINTLAVLNAAAHCHGESSKASLKQILPHLEKRPNDVGLLLTLPSSTSTSSPTIRAPPSHFLKNSSNASKNPPLPPISTCVSHLASSL
jgi:signal recognition particle subunit SRP72